MCFLERKPVAYVENEEKNFDNVYVDNFAVATCRLRKK